jgi:hypothetical protein
MQGRIIDMEKLMRQNELMPAVGNVRVNARGDELGPGGKIVKRREDIVNEYYEPSAGKQKSGIVQTKDSPEYSVQNTGSKSKQRGKNEG